VYPTLPSWVEGVVTVLGLTAAVAAGVLLAVHRHADHEAAEKVGQFCLGFVFFATLVEMNNEVAAANTEWHIHYENGGFVANRPPMPYAGLGGFLKAMFGPYLKDLAVHLAVTAVAFGLAWVVVTYRSRRAASPAG
jgi:NADH:ubiquinone oxidoreductase subunit K